MKNNIKKNLTIAEEQSRLRGMGGASIAAKNGRKFVVFL
jgi:hypothetical protein